MPSNILLLPLLLLLSKCKTPCRAKSDKRNELLLRRAGRSRHSGSRRNAWRGRNARRHSRPGCDGSSRYTGISRSATGNAHERLAARGALGCKHIIYLAALRTSLVKAYFSRSKTHNVILSRLLLLYSLHVVLPGFEAPTPVLRHMTDRRPNRLP